MPRYTKKDFPTHNIRRFLETAPEQLHNVVPLATRR